MFQGAEASGSKGVKELWSFDTRMARRWKPRKRHSSSSWNPKAKNGGGGGKASREGDSADSALLWQNWTTRRDLMRYLVAYRQGCLAFCEDSRREKMSDLMEEEQRPIVDNEQPVSLSTSGAIDRIVFALWNFIINVPVIRRHSKDASALDPKDFVIGGVILPPLTKDVFRCRCLHLPSILSSRQRRLVHSCCVEADLFHDSYGAASFRNIQDNNCANPPRVVVISCYADGFDTVIPLQEERRRNIVSSFTNGDDKTGSQSIYLHTFKPWYCRLEHQDDDPRNIASLSFTSVRIPFDKKNNSIGVTVGVENERTPIKSNYSNSSSVRFSISSSVLSFRARAEEEAVAAIFKLIDQPGRCLRDKRDAIVHEVWSQASLADVDPPDLSTSATESSSLPWMLVDTAEKVKQCIRELEEACPCEIAFDVEAYNVSKYTQITCLLQLSSDAGKSYVIDTLAPGVWNEVPGLASLLANPNIVKVGHSIAGLDTRCLHRDFGCFLVNVFDTYEASKVLGLESQGLAKVCSHYGLRNSDVYVQLKETNQSCDWQIRPLTEPMIQYARYDVHYLLKLRWLMMRDMVEKDFWEGSDNQGVAHNGQIRYFDLGNVDNAVPGNGAVNSDYSEFFTPAKTSGDEFEFVDAGLQSSDNNDDDDETFKTPRQPSKSDDDLFLTPSSSVRNFSDLDEEEVDTRVDNKIDFPSQAAVEITASQLRLQPLLMSCLSISQERCRDLWSHKAEPHLNNELLVSLTKRAKRGEVNWSTYNTELYDALYQWRNQVAHQMECLPGFVAPLDFLVAVAWKCPTTEAGLRRIKYQLPTVLESNRECLSDLLDILLRRALQGGEAVATGTVYYYSSLNLAYDYDLPKGILERFNMNNSSVEDIALNCFVIGTIGFGAAMTLLDTRRQLLRGAR